MLEGAERYGWADQESSCMLRSADVWPEEVACGALSLNLQDLSMMRKGLFRPVSFCVREDEPYFGTAVAMCVPMLQWL